MPPLLYRQNSDFDPRQGLEFRALQEFLKAHKGFGFRVEARSRRRRLGDSSRGGAENDDFYRSAKASCRTS